MLKKSSKRTERRSKKNYFRAYFLWILILLLSQRIQKCNKKWKNVNFFYLGHVLARPNHNETPKIDVATNYDVTKILQHFGPLPVNMFIMFSTKLWEGKSKYFGYDLKIWWILCHCQLCCYCEQDVESTNIFADNYSCKCFRLLNTETKQNVFGSDVKFEQII